MIMLQIVTFKVASINFEERLLRAQRFGIQNVTPVNYSSADWLRDSDRNWNLGIQTSQPANQHGNIIELSSPDIRRQSIRHHSEGKHTHRQERELLGSNKKIEGSNDEFTDNKITNHRAHVAGNEMHATTMRGLSACGQEIEQASQRIGGTGNSGGSAFDRARKAAVEAIERFTGYLERIALKLKHATVNSGAATNHSDQTTPAEDDMRM